MVEVYQTDDQGALTLDTPFILTNADRVKGSGVLWALHEGLTLTISDLLYLMMSISDNVATNALIRSVGMDAVNHHAGTGLETLDSGSIDGRPACQA